METFVTVYAEQTPNPETLKFVVNQHVSRGGSFDFPTKEEAEKSPLAKALFELPYVRGVFIAADFITVTKDPEYTWAELLPKIRVFLKEYLTEKKEVITDALMDMVPSFAESESDDEVVKQIKEILATKIKPVVEMDGGAIDYVDFQDGIVKLAMRGSCSGCPSSMVTLKAGIEGLLKRLVPGVNEVVAEAL